MWCCSIRLTPMKIKYSRNMIKPNTLLIFHLQDTMEMMKKRSTIKSSTVAQESPLLLTATGDKMWTSECRSQGTGRL